MEKVIRAEMSSDLGEAIEGDIGDVDVLRAVGAASQDRNLDVALSLYRLITRSDSHALHVVIAGLRAFAQRKNIDFKETNLVRVIEWVVNPVCPDCHGRGFPLMSPSAPVLSDEPCPACHGSGRRDPGFAENEAALADYLSGLQGHAYFAIARKLYGTHDED